MPELRKYLVATLVGVSRGERFTVIAWRCGQCKHAWLDEQPDS